MQKFCENCHEFVNYSEKKIKKSQIIKGKEINYFGKEAYCEHCENSIFVPEIHDFNLSELDKEYRSVNDLIQIGEIEEILSKYDIGVRPLSLVLGWGEGTLTRFKKGDIPTPQFSDTLKTILHDYKCLEELLEKNKAEISGLAYNKCKTAIEKLRHSNSDLEMTEDKIDQVVKYLINKCVDITPLSLQKLLYYAQSFNKVFYNRFLFTNDCEAWVHGPVYRSIYHKYSGFGYNTIEEDMNEFTNIKLNVTEIELLDSIADNLGCYSGKILEKMTHAEAPWLETRDGLGPNVASDRVIEKDLIEEYFIKIKDKYNMVNPSDIKDYSENLFNKIHM